MTPSLKTWKRGRPEGSIRIDEKPDLTKTPVARFDLLKTDSYATMAIQFSRGCPFQCEFCDIIQLYGRKPRTKLPQQITAELDALLKLGWRKQVFIVDDNFIGNHRHALVLAQEFAKWQQAHGYPLAFYTEASMDLARHPELLEAMVKANFLHVFVGIESPAKASLVEAKKLQNLSMDPIDSIKILQQGGLWVTGGFILGFDSDTQDTFEEQIRFIERAAIPWALVNFLHALPQTALHARMQREGRLIEGSINSRDGTAPNFRTMLPPDVLLKGFQKTISSIYDPTQFYERALRSLQVWKTRNEQRPAQQPGSGRDCQDHAPLDLASRLKVFLPLAILEILVSTHVSVLHKSHENLDRLYHPDRRTPLYSLC